MFSILHVFAFELLQLTRISQMVVLLLPKHFINSLSPRDETVEFANSLYLDEVAHDELPHLDLHCLPSSL